MEWGPSNTSGASSVLKSRKDEVLSIKLKFIGRSCPGDEISTDGSYKNVGLPLVAGVLHVSSIVSLSTEISTKGWSIVCSAKLKVKEINEWMKDWMNGCCSSGTRLRGWRTGPPSINTELVKPSYGCTCTKIASILGYCWVYSDTPSPQPHLGTCILAGLVYSQLTLGVKHYQFYFFKFSYYYIDHLQVMF